MPGDNSSNSILKKQKAQNCLIGCLAVLILVVVILVAGYYWMATPGPQVPTDEFAGSDSLALLHVEGLREDPGLAMFMQRFLEELQKLQERQMDREEIPWFVRFLGSRNRTISDNQVDDALSDLPTDLTITLELIEDGDPEWVVAVNFSQFPRLMRLGFWVGSFFVETRDFNGYQIMRVDPRQRFAVTFVDHTALVAQTGNALEHVLLRQSSENSDRGTGLLRSYTIRNPRWNVYGVIANREGTLAWLLKSALSRWIEQAEALDRNALEKELSGIDYVQVGIDVVDENTLEAEFRFDCYSNQDAIELNERINLGEMIAKPLWQNEGLEVEISQRVDSRSVTVNAEILNIIRVLTKKIEEADQTKK
jgi:hypothetical protein